MASVLRGPSHSLSTLLHWGKQITVLWTAFGEAHKALWGTKALSLTAYWELKLVNNCMSQLESGSFTPSQALKWLVLANSLTVTSERLCSRATQLRPSWIPGPQKLYMCACSVVSDSLKPHRLQPARLLCPWDFSGKNTGVGCRFLLQGLFLTQGANWHLLCLLHCRWILYHWATKEAHKNCEVINICCFQPHVLG